VDREAQLAAELDALRALCTETCAPNERQELLKFLSQHEFIALEHAVVFESLRTLLRRGPISQVRLRVHLNNRGFPDTDVEKYFQPRRSAAAESRLPGKATS
jgi:hypothetical protein